MSMGGAMPGFCGCLAGGWALNQAVCSVESSVVDSRRSRTDSRAILRAYVVGLVVGWGFDGGGPALGGFEDLGQGLAQVGVARAVVVEVVGELVGDGGELLEEVVGV